MADRPRNASRPDGDFIIDTTAGTVTCPNGDTVRIDRTGSAVFGARCRDCPLRSRCTTARRGKQVKVNEHHDLLAIGLAHRCALRRLINLGIEWANGWTLAT